MLRPISRALRTSSKPCTVALQAPTASPLRYAEQLEVGCLDRRALRNDLTGKTSLRRLTMTDPATTKLSSKGQVVIPEEIRERLGLKPGAQFVFVCDRDVVILKVIHNPYMTEFD